ncbi:hypothetical protein CYJ76_02920 [Kytococcus schroeteri]|uniref:Helicase XPB/Ssl2 N-terminal domain-containing protein n=2 Tax=Kytococcus TaxID=57499 RepID=A0A2I1PCB4_9MICO|nr:helicase-associated domain-containing protein [Kytococcus schroeteri]PKZ42267.1 hypothetical protein CYJ76_02920 [Kytococcus schroeteri]
MTPSDGSGGFRSLAADLRGRSEAELTDLLLTRPDLARHTIGDLASLAAAATTTASLTRALDALTRPELQVLESAMVLAPATADAVAAATGADVATVSAHLDALWTAALLWRSPEGLRPVRVLAELLPTPAGLAPAATPAPTVPTDRLAALTGPERALVDALLWGPPVGEVTARAPQATREARTALVADGVLTDLSPTRVQLPREVALALREGRTHRHLETEPPTPTDPTATDGRGDDPQRVDAAAAEVSGLLALTDELLLTLERDPAPVLANGGVGVRDVTALGRRLGLETDATHLLLTVAHAADLVDVGALPGAAEHRWGPTPEADRWQALDDAERAARLLAAWWTTPLDAGHTEGERRTNALAPAAASPTARRRRQDLLTELADLGGTTAGAEDLLARWAWRHPLRRPPAAAEVARLLEQARLLGLASSPLRHTDRWAASPWLVALAGGSTPEDPLGPVTAALADALPEATSSMLVQADLTAVVPGRPTPALTRLLHAATDVESRGGASTHRFSERSLRRALDAGHQAADLREAISAASATGLPQPVDYLLREVSAGHGRVHVSDARAVLAVDDPALASRMLHDPELAPVGLTQVAPTVLTSHLSSTQARSFLRDHGYGPSVGEDATTGPARVTPRGAPPVRSRPLTRELAADRARALRAATAATPDAGEPTRAAGPTPPPRTTSDPVVVQAALRDAAADGAPVWIWHTDDLGAVRSTLVTPTSVDGGRLFGVKDAERLPRAWSIHRISGVAPASPAQPW